MKTKYHGEINETDFPALTFEEGIPGFPAEKDFVLVPLDQQSPFTVMQSKKEPELAFIIVNPFDFYPDYEIQLSDTTIAKLGIEQESDVMIFSILTVQNPFKNTTANLQAPVVLNKKNKKARQIILNQSEYSTKHLITSPLVKEKR
ncbi:flagellar assembly protein FliW [Jeotgalibacillus sp. R-1-5s-1]|uniref:flagellar assembly protein FliW n=1 Tax=Jeotgalibacillus sp. R-1-5s-1 TaxID=2555897 RepID=UPI00106C00FC|nr:flagellar assembly protein FliW [Jeotgalibacillus sp. R-1-5s-1]TFD95790.1 flagellar assembly protein FliW [Jeotgalibacillus sp. R-1-5s-1]